jgi:hypothetical protein
MKEKGGRKKVLQYEKEYEKEVKIRIRKLD